MASAYARMTTDWLDWQRPYRLGVLLVLPPGRLRKEVNELRARYDPRSHAIAEAHVSLTVPFQKEPDDGLWSELDRVASGFTPFTIRYGPLVSFLPKPGAALGIAPKDELGTGRELPLDRTHGAQVGLFILGWSLFCS
jgi:2'-5' RNA ligase superfamily